MSVSNATSASALGAANTIAATASWRDYLQMTKPTIGLLVVVTAVPSLLLAASTLPRWTTVVSCLLGTYLASMSAGVFNHFVDQAADSKMQRTQSRPLPRGKVRPAQALAWGVLLGILSFILLYLGTNPLTALVALAANAFYVFVYTMYLKPRTPQNIVIGGAAGAVGPLIGWAAISGALSWQAWVLFAVIFLWTPPHFWALALKYKDDYALAKIPMYPVVYGDERTRRYIFGYSLTLLPAICLLFIFKSAGWIYFAPALAMTMYFCWLSFRLYRQHSNQTAMKVFHFSCLYLFGVFGALALDRLAALL